MQPALATLLGEGTAGLSANTVSRLKQSWEHDDNQWRQRELGKYRYICIRADGVYCNVRVDDKLCLL